jgi:hypothetical protein
MGRKNAYIKLLFLLSAFSVLLGGQVISACATELTSICGGRIIWVDDRGLDGDMSYHRAGKPDEDRAVCIPGGMVPRRVYIESLKKIRKYRKACQYLDGVRSGSYCRLSEDGRRCDYVKVEFTEEQKQEICDHFSKTWEYK